ncbi:MAG: flavodoxin family protein [Desulfotomaculaceae bacterium]|nr:flavodoxin family protein [Desulfotomaculaceae bacterium]
MKRVLGIVSSPRKLGNSEILAKAAMEATGADNLELIRLTDLNLKPCQACYRCLPKDKPCLIEDDLDFLLDKIRLADAVVLAAPCYILGPNASIKILQDRLLSLGSKIEQYAGKTCIAITTYGRPGVEGYAEAALNLTAYFMHLQLVDCASFLGANPASVLEDPANLQRVQKMGRALFDPGYQRTPKPNECPACWSDILRYDGKNLICPLCGTKGEITVEGQAVKLKFFPQVNHRFSEEGKREHNEVFLPNKKEEFLAKRKYYKELQQPYRQIGNWVTPEQK